MTKIINCKYIFFESNIAWFSLTVTRASDARHVLVMMVVIKLQALRFVTTSCEDSNEDESW